MTEDDQTRLSVSEVSRLHERLSEEERDELLQCLLIAAPRGGAAMIQMLEQTLLCHALEELVDEHSLGCP